MCVRPALQVLSNKLDKYYNVSMKSKPTSAIYCSRRYSCVVHFETNMTAMQGGSIGESFGGLTLSIFLWKEGSSFLGYISSHDH